MSFATAPLYCPCSRHALGNHGSDRDTCGVSTDDAPRTMTRFTDRDAAQTRFFGTQNYQGHYGDAYKLLFPNYRGQVYTNDLPTHDDSVPLGYRFGYPARTPLAMVGSTGSPYFLIVPQSQVRGTQWFQPPPAGGGPASAPAAQKQ